MDTFKYTCAYCHEQYIPKRRILKSTVVIAVDQKRITEDKSKATALKKQIRGSKDELTVQSKELITPKKQSVEKMSMAGVGNVVAGSLLAGLILSFTKGDGNQPATKNDIAGIINKFQRYHLITNLPARPFNKRPYFDLHTNKVEYF